MKRSVSFLLIAAMLFAMLPFSAISVFAADSTVTDSQGVIYTLSYDGTYYYVEDCDESATSIVIPAEINGLPVKEIGYYAFEYCESLASMVIPDSVTSIGEVSFGGCRSLTSIVIPDSVTSIGGWAFQYCSSLTSIVIPDGVTIIGEGAFTGCTSLTDISVDKNNPNYSSVNGVLFDKDITKLIRYPAGKTETTYVIPEGVTSIGDSAFSYCTSLTSIVIPESVTSIGDWAFGFTSLTSIVIPDGVTSIGGSAFSYCTSLTSIVIPDSVTSIGGWAFDGWTDEQTIYCCIESQPSGWNSYWSNYRNVNIVWGYNPDPEPEPDTEVTDSQGVKYTLSEDGTYYYVSGYNGTAASVVIPGTVNDIPVKEIGGWAFQYCSSLTSIVIPDGVTSIGDNAFYNCTSLTSIVIPESVASIGDNAFYNCISLTEINVDANNPNYSSVNGVLFNKDKTEIICYPAGKTETAYTIPEGVTRIGDYAFLGHTSLTSVEIPEGVTSIGESAFAACASLTSIVIPGSVMSIGNHALQECTSLTSIAIPNSVTSIGDYAFSGWSSYQSIYFEADAPYESWDYIWDYNCEATIYYNGKKAPQRSFTDEQGVSYELSYDKTYYTVVQYNGWNPGIVIPGEIDGVPVKEISNDVFSWRSEISSIVIPQSVTYIGWGAFSGWQEYQSIYFEADAPSENMNDGWDYDCNAAIYFNGKKAPRKWVTDEQGVEYRLSEDKAFYTVVYGQGWYSNIVIPSEIDGVPVTVIGSGAFSGRPEINSIVIPESVVYIGWDAFDGWSSYQSIYFEADAPFGEMEFNWEEHCEAAIYYNGKKQPKKYFTDEQGVSYELSYDKTYYTVLRYEGWYSEIVIPGEIDGVPVTVISDGAFSWRSEISSIVIPKSVINIGGSTFDGWWSYQSIYFEADAPHESWGDYWDSSCEATIYFNGKKAPQKWVTDEQGVEYILSYDKTYYTVVHYNGGNTSIVIPGEIDGVPVKEIGDWAFGYTSLTSIVIPDSVTSIGDNAFSYCTSLNNIVIPGSVVYIGRYAFECWTSEQTIYICAESQPGGWVSYWANFCEANIVWGFVKGDINGDKKINALDYVLAKRHFLNTYTLTGDAFVAADLNGNGKIDVTEYVLIKRHCLGTYVIK